MRNTFSLPERPCFHSQKDHAPSQLSEEITDYWKKKFYKSCPKQCKGIGFAFFIFFKLLFIQNFSIK